MRINITIEHSFGDVADFAKFASAMKLLAAEFGDEPAPKFKPAKEKPPEDTVTKAAVPVFKSDFGKLKAGEDPVEARETFMPPEAENVFGAVESAPAETSAPPETKPKTKRGRPKKEKKAEAAPAPELPLAPAPAPAATAQTPSADLMQTFGQFISAVGNTQMVDFMKALGYSRPSHVPAEDHAAVIQLVREIMEGVKQFGMPTADKIKARFAELKSGQ